MACMYYHAVSTLNIAAITHKFLIVGHTQNEGDSMHSTIEKEKKRVLKRSKEKDGTSTMAIAIATPYQWTPILRLAKKTGKPYIVKEVATEDILDLKSLEAEMGTNFKVNQEKEKVLWGEIKVIQVRKGESVLYYKTDYEEPFQEISFVSKRSHGRPSALETTLKLAYKETPKIPPAKAKDLLDLCVANIIPKVHQQFYKSLKY